MNNRFNTKNFKSLLPWFLLALAVLAAHQVLSHLGIFLDVLRELWIIVTPFFSGFLIAYILNIPRNGIERFLAWTKVGFFVKRRKMLSVILVYLLFLLLVALILTIVIPAIVNAISLFITNFEAHYENALQFVANINAMDILGLHIPIDEALGSFRDWVHGIQLGDILAQLNTVIDVSGAIFGGVFHTFIALISSVYMLAGKDRILAFFRRAFRAVTSNNVYQVTLKHIQGLNKNFKQYVHTQTIDGLILGTMATIALWIMGSPFALTLGIMLGIVNYVPYFGSIFGTIIAVVVVAFTQGLGMGLIATITLLVIQQIDANVIQPKLMSGSFSLSPLLVIISITVGGAFAGVLGMIVAIPIVAVLKDILESVIAHYEQRRGEIPPDGDE